MLEVTRIVQTNQGALFLGRVVSTLLLNVYLTKASFYSID